MAPDCCTGNFLQALFNEVIYFPSRPGYTDPLVKRRVLVSCFSAQQGPAAWHAVSQELAESCLQLHVSGLTSLLNRLWDCSK